MVRGRGWGSSALPSWPTSISWGMATFTSDGDKGYMRACMCAHVCVCVHCGNCPCPHNCQALCRQDREGRAHRPATGTLPPTHQPQRPCPKKGHLCLASPSTLCPGSDGEHGASGIQLGGSFWQPPHHLLKLLLSNLFLASNNVIPTSKKGKGGSFRQEPVQTLRC